MLNEEGIDSITTRKLAQRLGIKSPTLYWHFKNKSLLMEAMAETIINEHHLVSLPHDGMTWQDFVQAYGTTQMSGNLKALRILVVFKFRLL